MTLRYKRDRSPAHKAHATRNKMYRRIRDSILILDCTAKSVEKCSEGEFLEKYLEILNHQLRVDGKKEIYFKRLQVHGPRQLKELLENSDHYTIHLSSHGKVDKTGKIDKTFLDLSRGRLFAEDLTDIWGNREKKDRPLLLVLSACYAGHMDLIKALSKDGCRYCIAPVNPPDWVHAAIFSTFFYTYLFLRRIKPVAAYHKTIRVLPILTGKWTMFDNGNEIPEHFRTYYP